MPKCGADMDMVLKSLEGSWQVYARFQAVFLVTALLEEKQNYEQLWNQVLLTSVAWQLFGKFDDTALCSKKPELRRVTLAQMSRLLGKKGEKHELAPLLPGAMRLKIDAAIKMKPI